MELTKRYSQALQLTYELHHQQTRKDGEVPYLSHLLGVSSIVLRYGGNEDEAIAALLHDAVEDQGGTKTLNLVRDEFGDQVAHIVEGCSDTDRTPKPPWKERKDQYLAHLRETDESTLIVSASDKLYNALDCVRTHSIIGEQLWDLFNVTEEETKWYYQSLSDVFEERLSEFPQLTSLLSEAIRVINILVNLP